MSPDAPIALAPGVAEASRAAAPTRWHRAGWHRTGCATSMALVAGLSLPFHQMAYSPRAPSAIMAACRAGACRRAAAIVGEGARLALDGQSAMDAACRADRWLLRLIRGFDDASGLLRIAGDDERRAGQDFLQFDNEALSTAVARLNRHARRAIVIRDARVAALRISGAFPARDSTGFVETLLLLYPLRVRHLPDGRLELLSRP